MKNQSKNSPKYTKGQRVSFVNTGNYEGIIIDSRPSQTMKGDPCHDYLIREDHWSESYPHAQEWRGEEQITGIITEAPAKESPAVEETSQVVTTYKLTKKDTGRKSGRFHYQVIDQDGAVISERKSNRDYVACTINGEFYFGRVDLIGKGSHKKCIDKANHWLSQDPSFYIDSEWSSLNTEQDVEDYKNKLRERISVLNKIAYLVDEKDEAPAKESPAEELVTEAELDDQGSVSFTNCDDDLVTLSKLFNPPSWASPFVVQLNCKTIATYKTLRGALNRIQKMSEEREPLVRVDDEDQLPLTLSDEFSEEPSLETECEECRGEGEIYVDTSHQCTKYRNDCCGGCGYDVKCEACDGSGIVNETSLEDKFLFHKSHFVYAMQNENQTSATFHREKMEELEAEINAPIRSVGSQGEDLTEFKASQSSQISQEDTESTETEKVSEERADELRELMGETFDCELFDKAADFVIKDLHDRNKRSQAFLRLLSIPAVARIFCHQHNIK